METSRTCAIQNVSWPLGWRLIMEKGQKSLWKRSSSSTGQIVVGQGPKTLRSDFQMNFQLQEIEYSKVANSKGPLKDLPNVDSELKSSQCPDGRKHLVAT